MTIAPATQKIQLIEGQFTPSEASDIICGMLTEKIKFHKVQRLSEFIGNCESSDTDSHRRIAELEEERRKMKAFAAEARATGSKITISGTLQMSMED